MYKYRTHPTVPTSTVCRTRATEGADVLRARLDETVKELQSAQNALTATTARGKRDGGGKAEECDDEDMSELESEVRWFQSVELRGAAAARESGGGVLSRLYIFWYNRQFQEWCILESRVNREATVKGGNSTLVTSKISPADQ